MHSDIQPTLNRATTLCNEKGVKLTDKRKKILSTLLSAKKPLSAYELIDLCRAEHNLAIAPISIYRMLAFLEEENLIHKLKSANKFIACSHIDCEHQHETPQFLICHQCGKVKEIGIKESVFEKLTNEVHQAGFLLENVQLEFECLCIECANR